MAKTPISKRLGTKGKQAAKKHMGDETRVGNAELPPGIENGKARVTKVMFGQYKDGDNKGKDFFMATAVVLEPKKFDGLKVEGLQTRIGPEPLCDTPKAQGKRKTLEDHLDQVLNYFRLMGVDTKKLDFDDEYVYENTAQLIEEEKPVISFRTWQGQATEQFPNPRVQHEWLGVDEEYEDEDVDDESEEEEEEEADDTESEEEGDEEQSYTELGEAADGGDDEAIAELEELAREAGIDPDEIETYAELATMLEERDQEEEENSEEEESDEEESEDEEGDEESAAPEKGDFFKTKPKGSRKMIEVEITAVFPDRETVNAKDENGKIYKGIAWDQLEEV